MKKTTLIMCLCGIFAVGLAAVIAMICMSVTDNNKSSEEDYFPTEEVDEQTYNENLGVYAEQTGSDADVNNEEDSPSQLFITNSDFFDNTELPFYALSLFQPSCEEYLAKHTDISTWHISLSNYEYTKFDQKFVIHIEELPTKSYICTWDELQYGYVFEEGF